MFPKIEIVQYKAEKTVALKTIILMINISFSLMLRLISYERDIQIIRFFSTVLLSSFFCVFNTAGYFIQFLRMYRFKLII